MGIFFCMIIIAIVLISSSSNSPIMNNNYYHAHAATLAEKQLQGTNNNNNNNNNNSTNNNNTNNNTTNNNPISVSFGGSRQLLYCLPTVYYSLQLWMKNIIDDEAWSRMMVKSNLRAENLQVGDFVALSNAISRKQ